MPKTSIEWTDRSWPVVNGCRRVSPGCGGAAGVGGCYAERLAATRLRKTDKYRGLAVLNSHGPHWTGVTRLWEKELAMPLRLRKPSRIFVADMGDLFYEEVSNETIAAIYWVMAATPWHTYQVLTKRARRMREWYEWVEREGGARRLGLLLHHAQRMMPSGGVSKRALDILGATQPILEQSWPLRHVWLGVSTEDQKRADERITELLRTSATVRFVSYEPAIGPIDFYPWLLEESIRTTETILDWIICGGESGPGSRPFHIAWARSVAEQCSDAGVAFFMKQLGADVRWDGISTPPNHWMPKDTEDAGDGSWRVHLKDRKGGTMSEWPVDLRVRQYPTLRSAPASDRRSGSREHADLRA